MRKAGWVFTVVLLVGSGILGLDNGSTELGSADTALKRVVVIGQLLYGLLGLVGGAGLARRRPWCVPICSVWAIAVVCVATIASFAFGDPTFAQKETITGTIAAAVSTSLIGIFVVWVARYSTRVPDPH